MKRIAVFTSGGDSPGMNAAVRAVVRTSIFHGYQAVGIMRGYEGLIDNELKILESQDVSGIIHQGGTILQTARSARFMTKEGRAIAYQNLKALNVEGVVAIGGDGTFTGAKIFMEEYPDVHFVGLPGTIDNDLLGSDYTIGFDTAVNTAMQAIDKIKDTANAHNRIFFVEVMGRDAGFIALRSAISTGAEALLIPETEDNLPALATLLKNNILKKKRSNIVIVAEGDEAGGAFEVSKIIKGEIPGADIRVTILGHIQRGGSPTCMDRVLATRLGSEAVECLIRGESGFMLGQIHTQIVKTPFGNAIKHHDKIPVALLNLIETLG
jgi:6-phosphofructokinase 1